MVFGKIAPGRVEDLRPVGQGADLDLHPHRRDQGDALHAARRRPRPAPPTCWSTSRASRARCSPTATRPSTTRRGPTSDGLVQRGEQVRTLVTVKNIGQGRRLHTEAVLRNGTGQEGILISAGRFEAKDLGPGEIEDLLVRLRGPPRLQGRRLPAGAVGRPPESCASPRKATIQRALEGLTRSLAKELKRAITVQLVYVAEGAEDEIESTLRFLLSPRSAYVSAQVIRIGPPVGPHAAPADWNQPLAGRKVLVTGASRGIGASIAEVMAREGAQRDLPRRAAGAAGVSTRSPRRWAARAIALDIGADDAPQRPGRRREGRRAAGTWWCTTPASRATRPSPT